MNCYVEIYILEGYILYGYAIDVNQNKRELECGKINIDKKIKLDTVKGIIEKNKLQDLCRKMQEKTFILHSSIGEINGGLINRSSILLKSKDDYDNQSGSILKNVSTVSSFCNVDKETLIRKIINSNHNDFRSRDKLDLILNKLNQVTGMNFKSVAFNKLGNFEIYSPLLEKSKFEISKVEDKCIYIEKMDRIEGNLFIGCRLYNDNERILDQVKEFDENKDRIEFNSPKEITGFKIKVWDRQNSDLIYENEITYMTSLKMDINIINRNLNIEDDWTKELETSYSKGKKQIDKIKNVKKYNNMHNEIMSQRDKDDLWMIENNRIPMLKEKYIKSYSKGFFIEEPKDKSGEIKSFIKIREYIDNCNLEKCIIVDPFFSIKSAQKILSRIENENMVLEIISSLELKDPDTNNKSENILNEVKTFIDNNINIIHRNLKFYNITSGKSQAFHDRYLIRVFKNGTMDGVMMSNSLNSMGQSYPFAVTPLEKEVLFNIYEYIYRLKTNSKYKNTEIYNYESKTKKINYIEKSKNDIEKYNNSEDKIYDIFNKYKISDINERKNILLQIANIMSTSNSINVMDISTFIKHEGINIDELTNLILELIIESEKNKDKEKSIDWLSMREYVSRLVDENLKYEDLKVNFTNLPSIYGFNLIEIYMLCKLLLNINESKNIKFLKDSKSVVVFICIIERITMYEFNKNLYSNMVNSNNKSIQKLAYSWILECSNKYYGIDDKIKFLDEVEFINNLDLVFYAIGEFSKKINKIKEYEELVNLLWEKIRCIENIQKFICKDNIADLIEYMKCGDEHINIRNLLKLNEIINDTSLNLLITEEINYIFKSMLAKCTTQYNIYEEGYIIYYAAKATINKQCLIKEDIKNVIDKENKKDFIRFSKPNIIDIDYDTFYKLGPKVMYRCLYFSHIANHCENIIDKKYIINELMDIFKKYIVYNIWELKQLNHIILEFISYVFDWIELDLVENETIIEIIEASPSWIKCILYLSEKKCNLEKIRDLLLNPYSIKHIREDMFILSNIGELLVYKKITEHQEEQNLECLKNKFIEMWINKEEYREYLICIEKNNLSEKLEWKNRGFFYSKCLK